MPKFSCKCGHPFDLNGIPSSDGLRVVTEVALDSLPETSSSEELLDVISKEGWQMFRCPDCRRIAVFWDRDSVYATFYSAE